MPNQTKGEKGGHGGPQTPAGKLRSRRNARKHGIFSSELTMSAAEKGEFDELRASLSPRQNHDDPLRELLFDNLLAATWHMKIALRAWQIAANAGTQEFPADSDPDVDASPAFSFPYRLTRLEIRRRQKLLEIVRAEFDRSGHIPEDLKAAIAKAFGPGTAQILADWEPILKHVVSIRMANSVATKARYYSITPLPTPTPEEVAECTATESFVRHQMTRKLLDLEADHLNLALHHANGPSGDTTGVGGNLRIDLAERYLTTACRDFYRALHEYQNGGRPDTDSD